MSYGTIGMKCCCSAQVLAAVFLLRFLFLQRWLKAQRLAVKLQFLLHTVHDAAFLDKTVALTFIQHISAQEVTRHTERGRYVLALEAFGFASIADDFALGRWHNLKTL